MRINLKVLIGFLLVATISNNKVIGQTVGPNSPGNGSSVNTGGPAWNNPNNITASDDSWASVSVSDTQASDALVATNFGFAIPSNATIDGITVTVERYTSFGINFSPFYFTYVIDATIRLTKDGTNPVGNDKAIGTSWSWFGDASATYGGPADLWGTTWTYSDINSGNFGVYIQAICGGGSGTETGYVDHVTVTVDYTVPTPVELISFDGKVIEEVIELKWQTGWERNNDFYTIEKSSNGLNYTELATVEGKGTTEFISDYTYIDPLPYKGNNYFRLTQTDFDGTFEVFKPIMISFEKEGEMMKIYPNPVVNKEVNLIVNPDLLKGENNNTYILVRNITGEIIHQQNIPTDHLGVKISLNKRFTSGMYILELHSPYGNTSEKLIVN